ncbi:hypothetical protein N9Y74_02735 [Alphaproteobacteria bacterium]|nr:hypothetical protein [Alphaproteobacteria bacterium]
MNTALTIQKVKSALKKDLNNVFTIGDILYDAKCVIANNAPTNKVEVGAEDNLKRYITASKHCYANMFTELPFGKAVGDKFIRIANTEWLRELADHKTYSHNLPWGYNNLYELTHSQITNDDAKRELFIQIFRDGKFEVDGMMKASVKMTMKDIVALVGLTKETNTFDRDEFESQVEWNSGIAESFAPGIREQVESLRVEDRVKFENELKVLFHLFGITKPIEGIVKEAA